MGISEAAKSDWGGSEHSVYFVAEAGDVVPVPMGQQREMVLPRTGADKLIAAARRSESRPMNLSANTTYSPDTSRVSMSYNAAIPAQGGKKKP